MPLIKVTATKVLKTDKNKLTRSAVGKVLSGPQGRQIPISTAKKKIQPALRAPACMIWAIHQLSRSAKPLDSPQIVARRMSQLVLSQAKKLSNKTRLTMA
jgi:hypothetical protein